MIIPIAITVAAFALAIRADLKVDYIDYFGHEPLISGMRYLLATIVSLISWLIWSLA